MYHLLMFYDFSYPNDRAIPRFLFSVGPNSNLKAQNFKGDMLTPITLPSHLISSWTGFDEDLGV